MSVDAPVAAFLELLPVVDIYVQIQEPVRQWLGNKAHMKLEPERGERYRSCVMPFYYILRDQSRRGLGSCGTTDGERMLMQSFSSSHDMLSTDCASLVAGKLKRTKYSLFALNELLLFVFCSLLY